ncbi:MAG TPA: ATPase domain-containing protein, partial [Gemmatimonadales bacterium]
MRRRGPPVPKPVSLFRCTDCGAEQPKWAGRCDACGAWNTLVEEPLADRRSGGRAVGGARTFDRPPVRLSALSTQELGRLRTGIAELDFVLGGGIVPSSVILVGGEPGIGKSTLLLQAAAHLERASVRTLYVSGEESPEQLRLRADRLDADAGAVHVLGETNLEAILHHAGAIGAQAVFLDSIQTTYTEALEGAPGN